jgi:hypothetical protein
MARSEAETSEGVHAGRNRDIRRSVCMVTLAKKRLRLNGEPSLWSVLAGTGTLDVPSGDSC